MLTANAQRAVGRRAGQMRWQGRSGRQYALDQKSLEHFAMEDTCLYLIAKGSHVLWVGSTQDLVADPMSRTRFRLALDCATDVYSLPAPEHRLAMISDLEQAAPASEAVAQAA